jgi:hypothetical protein
VLKSKHMIRKYSEKKKRYYIFNPETGETKWEDTKQKSECETSSPSEPLPKGWIECWSKSKSKPYWYHAASNKYLWYRPKLLNNDKDDDEPLQPSKRARSEPASSSSSPSTSSSKVAIIVPYRDLHSEQKRAAHLTRFVPAMQSFLTDAGCNFKIYIIEQSKDGRKFNRGKLLNIGFDLAQREGCSIFVFHDVDLLPSKELAPSYTQLPLEGPCHIARVWNRYNDNPKYFGGIVAFSEEQFRKINGFPNNFWGWGGEDDEMGVRVDRVQLQRMKPVEGSITDMEEMTLDEKRVFLKAHEEQKCMVKWELWDEHDTTWSENGLKNLQYHEQKRIYLGNSSGDKIKSEQAQKITVDVCLNKHWSDEKAVESDTKL